VKIELHEITVRELSEGYEDKEEAGVIGYGGKLDIRPAYQREFIYKDKQRDAVIDTITKNFPLNVMYWSVKGDGTFEMIDGQQRTISICQYIEGDFAFMFKYFHNLNKEEKNKILDYKLQIYFCSGTDTERLQWFRTINIAGERLTDQELLNAVYAGSWVTDAKRYFSKSNCAAHSIGSDYLSGSAIRQEYLETAIHWISKGNIEQYMAVHQHDPTAIELWNYFQSVMGWVKATFTVKRKFMKGVAWGELYNDYQSKKLDPKAIEKETAELIADDEVERKSGIYPYILTRNEKYLSLRAFSDNIKQKVYEKQKGLCRKCKKFFKLEEMEADHIKPWHAGGKTIIENCQMLCKEHNREKSGQ
jgi:hypothetical protein